MTVCSTSLTTKLIPTCIETLVIGKVNDINTNVVVYIMDDTTDRLEAFETTSSPDGTVTIDVSEHSFSPSHTYRLYITKDKWIQDITIDGHTDNSIALRFEKVNGLTTINHTLSADV